MKLKLYSRFIPVIGSPGSQIARKAGAIISIGNEVFRRLSAYILLAFRSSINFKKK